MDSLVPLDVLHLVNLVGDAMIPGEIADGSEDPVVTKEIPGDDIPVGVRVDTVRCLEHRIGRDVLYRGPKPDLPLYLEPQGGRNYGQGSLERGVHASHGIVPADVLRRLTDTGSIAEDGVIPVQLILDGCVLIEGQVQVGRMRRAVEAWLYRTRHLNRDAAHPEIARAWRR